MRKLLVYLSVTMILFGVTLMDAFAQGNNYVTLKAGIFSPNDDIKGLNMFDTGYNIEVAYGYRVHPNFAIEAGIGRYSSEMEETEIFDNVEATASAIPITLTLKGIVSLEKAELYEGVGIGYYLSTLKTTEERRSKSQDASALGFYFVGGGGFYFSNNVILGLEVKWFEVKPKFDFNGNREKINFGGTIFNVVLKYRF